MIMKVRKTGITISIALAVAVLIIAILAVGMGLRKGEGEVFAEKMDSTKEETTVKRKSMRGMTAEETYQTLLDNGFVLPDSWKTCDKEYILEHAKFCVDSIIENDVFPSLLANYTELARFYIRIEKVVVEYEGIEDPFPDHDFEADLPEWGAGSK